MANITIRIDDDVLRRSQDYAQTHGMSLDALVCQLLERATVSTDRSTDELFRLMDELGADSEGTRWTRDSLYDV